MTRLDNTHDEETVQHVHNVGHPAKTDSGFCLIAPTRLPISAQVYKEIPPKSLWLSLEDLGL